MNNLELKLKLAKELPELIEVIDYSRLSSDWPQWSFFWLDGSKDETGRGKEVTDREWDWVAWTCIQMLVDDQATSPEHDNPMWIQQLEDVLWEHNKNIGLVEGAWNATWQQRADAYFKVKGT